MVHLLETPTWALMAVHKLEKGPQPAGLPLA